MADVVKIAKERRLRLEAEIGRLDDFIHMAELLLKYGEGPGGRPGPTTDRGEDRTVPSQLISELEAGRDTPRPATKAQTAADDSDTDNGHFVFNERTESDDELVLTEPVSAKDGAVDAQIGEKLRQRRWMLGMTKSQLADQVGVDGDMIQEYECGETHISTASMWRIATALGVPVTYFYEDSDATPSQNEETRRDSADPTRQDEAGRLARIA